MLQPIASGRRPTRSLSRPTPIFAATGRPISTAMAPTRSRVTTASTCALVTARRRSTGTDRCPQHACGQYGPRQIDRNSTSRPAMAARCRRRAPASCSATTIISSSAPVSITGGPIPGHVRARHDRPELLRHRHRGLHRPARGRHYPGQSDADNTYVGVYATNTFDITSQLSFTAGGRFNLAQIDLQDETGTSPLLNSRTMFRGSIRSSV